MAHHHENVSVDYLLLMPALVIDLWFEDIGKMTFFKDIWEQGKMVITWIRGHQAFTAKFGKLTRKEHLLPRESGLQKDGNRGLQ